MSNTNSAQNWRALARAKTNPTPAAELRPVAAAPAKKGRQKAAGKRGRQPSHPIVKLARRIDGLIRLAERRRVEVPPTLFAFRDRIAQTREMVDRTRAESTRLRAEGLAKLGAANAALKAAVKAATDAALKASPWVDPRRVAQNVQNHPALAERRRAAAEFHVGLKARLDALWAEARTSRDAIVATPEGVDFICDELYKLVAAAPRQKLGRRVRDPRAELGLAPEQIAERRSAPAVAHRVGEKTGRAGPKSWRFSAEARKREADATIRAAARSAENSAREWAAEEARAFKRAMAEVDSAMAALPDFEALLAG